MNAVPDIPKKTPSTSDILELNASLHVKEGRSQTALAIHDFWMSLVYFDLDLTLALIAHSASLLMGRTATLARAFIVFGFISTALTIRT